MGHKITIRMPQADLDLWMATLEAPENQDKQGKQALFRSGKYCCLGAGQYCKSGAVEMHHGLPSHAWLESVGWSFEGRNGRKGNDPWLPSINRHASCANDSGWYTFAELAKIIRRHAKGY